MDAVAYLHACTIAIYLPQYRLHVMRHGDGLAVRKCMLCVAEPDTTVAHVTVSRELVDTVRAIYAANRGLSGVILELEKIEFAHSQHCITVSMEDQIDATTVDNVTADTADLTIGEAQTPAAAEPMVKLESCDENIFEVPEKWARQSVTIAHMLDDASTDHNEPIPLPNVTKDRLEKIIAYWEHHVNDPPYDEKNDSKRTDDITPWDAEWCKTEEGNQEEQEKLFELVLAANYLDIKPMLDLTCKTIANMIKGKTPEQIRQTFNIKNDFTPEEEEQIRKENEWCMDM